MARRLIARLDGIVLDLRRGASAAAHSNFSEFVAEFSAALPDSNWDVDRILPILQQGLAAHERADYLGLADTLQYELRTEIASPEQ